MRGIKGDLLQIDGLWYSRPVPLVFNPPIDFLAMDLDIARRIDSDAYLIAHDPNDGHVHIRTDHDPLADTACHNEHDWLLANFVILALDAIRFTKPCRRNRPTDIFG
jgi:hypothetical protein